MRDFKPYFNGLSINIVKSVSIQYIRKVKTMSLTSVIINRLSIIRTGLIIDYRFSSD